MKLYAHIIGRLALDCQKTLEYQYYHYIYMQYHFNLILFRSGMVEGPRDISIETHWTGNVQTFHPHTIYKHTANIIIYPCIVDKYE